MRSATSTSSWGIPRRICDLFGLSVGAALRYTGTIDQPGLIEYSLRNAGPAPHPDKNDLAES
jgi:hypothetical protein